MQPPLVGPPDTQYLSSHDYSLGQLNTGVLKLS